MNKNFILAKKYLLTGSVGVFALLFSGCQKAELKETAAALPAEKRAEEELPEKRFPQVALKQTQILVQDASEVIPEIFLESVEGVDEYICGFRNTVLERSARQVCEAFWQEKEAAEQGTETKEPSLRSYTEVIPVESLTANLSLDVDGQYLTELVVTDQKGNAWISEVVVFLDSTAPVITGAKTVVVDLFSIDAESFAEEIQAVDDMFGDLSDRLVCEDAHVTADNRLVQTYSVTDYAGNTTTFERELIAMQSDRKAAEGASGSSEASGTDRKKAEEAFGLVNEQRVQQGLSALVWDEALYCMACERVQEIVQKFSHERPDGMQVTDALYAAGCTMGSGENIARHEDTASEVVTAWMNSEGHRDNILEPRFTKGTMACFFMDGVYYWVNLFKV